LTGLNALPELRQRLWRCAAYQVALIQFAARRFASHQNLTD
jgi:hypothetical protein